MPSKKRLPSTEPDADAVPGAPSAPTPADKGKAGGAQHVPASAEPGSASGTLQDRIHSLFSDLQSAAAGTDDLEPAPYPMPPPPEKPFGKDEGGVSEHGGAAEHKALDYPRGLPGSLGEGSQISAIETPMLGLLLDETAQSSDGDAASGLQFTAEPITEIGYASLASGRPAAIPSQMAVPFQVQTTSAASQRGLLEIVDQTPDRFWSEDERRLVEQVADQLSLALENARLFQETQNALLVAEERRQVADTLSEIARVVGSSLDLQEVVERLLDQLPNLIEYNSASIQLVNENRRQLIGGRGFDVEKAKIEESYFHRPIQDDALIYSAYRTRQPVLISDTYHDPRWQVLPNTAHIRCWMVAPLVAGADVLGFLTLDSSILGSYTGETAALASAFAAQAAVAIRNARLFQQVQATLAETDALYQASSEMNAVQNYDDVLNILRESTIVGHSAATWAALSLYDHPWMDKTPPEWFILLARWRSEPALSTASAAEGTTPPAGAATLERPLTTRYPMTSWSTASQFLRPDQSVYIEDAENSPLLDQTARQVYVERLNAKSMLTAPLNVGGQWIGQIIVVYDRQLSLGQRELRVLQTLSAQAAVAIQNLRLFAETRRRATQLETAAEIARDTSGTLALDMLLNRTVNLIRDRYGYYHASIFLIDESGRSAVVRESTGIAGQELKRRAHSLPVGSQSVIGQVTQTGQTLVLNDVTESEMHRPNPLLPDTRAEMSIPLKIGPRIIGALDVQSAQVDAFTGDDVAVLQVLADQIAVAVDNARSYELAQQAISETAQRVQELSTIYEVSQAIAGATMQTLQIANTIVSRFVNLFPVDRVALYFLDRIEFIPETPQSYTPEPIPALKMMASTSPRGDLPLWEELLPIEKYPFGAVAVKRVTQTGRPLVVQADLPISVLVTALDPEAVRLRESQGLMQQGGLRTLVLIPLAVKGQVIGMVELQARTLPIQPDASQLNLVMTIANSAAVSLENARLYEDQLATAEKLREVDKLKSQFLANMSHELRTPLNSIIGFSRVILKGIDGPISDLQQQDLTAIHNAGTHLLQLINDVLDISKIEAGKMELAFDDAVNLADIVNSALSTATGLTKDKPIRLERNIEPGLPTVRADSMRLRQVIINFLSNAAKFTEEGAITVSVTTQTSALGQPEIRLGVTDTGPGIAKADQTKLFQAFSQVDGSATRKVGGTGLGLSISRLLVEMHGGYIGVESEEGQGSTFYFVLPLTTAATDGEPLPDPNARYNAAAKPENKAPAIAPAANVAAFPGAGYNVPAQGEAQTAQPAVIETPPAGPAVAATTSPVAGANTLDPAQVQRVRPLPTEGGVAVLSGPQAEKKTVLIIDDDRQVINLYDRYLRENGFNTISLTDSALALETARLLHPYAITLDVMMPNRDGWQVLQSLKNDATTRDIPVIICSIVEDHEKGFSLGATDYLNKPIMEEDLLKALKRINGDGAIRDILVVDDDPQILRLVEKLLHSSGLFKARLAEGGIAGLSMLQSDPPDAVILDLFMPDMDGFAVLEAMRSNPDTRAIPAIVFTAADLDESQKQRLAEFSQQLLHKSDFKEEDILHSLQQALHRLGGSP